MKIKISPHFLPLLENRKRFLVLYGGGGSGKSEFAGRKVFYRCMSEGGHRFLILRKVRSRIYESVVEVMISILDANEIEYNYNKSRRIISFYNVAGKLNELMFDGLDDREKIKSIKGITSVWLEETTEFTRDDFIQIDLRLREELGLYHQIIMSFNPDEGKAPWLKKMFFDEKIYADDTEIHHSTVDDNPIPAVRARYRRRLDRLDDPVYLDIYRLGIWAIAKGLIYNWDVQDLPSIQFDEIWYGGDFGFSVDPAALVKIYRKGDEYWIQEIIYETGLTNQALAERMKNDSRVNVADPSYWDSAEPKSIQELFDAGINAHEASKGKGSVKARIDYLKSLKIHIVTGSYNLIDERKSYKYAVDKNGEPLPMPVDYFNHGMDATGYGIYTHVRDRVIPRVW